MAEKEPILPRALAKAGGRRQGLADAIDEKKATVDGWFTRGKPSGRGRLKLEAYVGNEATAIRENPAPYTHCVIPIALLDKLDALVEAALAIREVIQEQRQALGAARKAERPG